MKNQITKADDVFWVDKLLGSDDSNGSETSPSTTKLMYFELLCPSSAFLSGVIPNHPNSFNSRNQNALLSFHLPCPYTALWAPSCCSKTKDSTFSMDCGSSHFLYWTFDEIDSFTYISGEWNRWCPKTSSTSHRGNYRGFENGCFLFNEPIVKNFVLFIFFSPFTSQLLLSKSSVLVASTNPS